VPGVNAGPRATKKAYHPGVQQAIGEMVLEFEGIDPHLDRVAQDWTDGVQHGAGWVVKIIAAKHHAVESAWKVVDRPLDVAGDFGIFRRGPFEQLFRDARLGRLHPANAMLSHELAAKLTLGISPDEAPRWG
jgi:alkylation response protein AidB-like acyl-CoA dehydrogenase